MDDIRVRGMFSAREEIFAEDTGQGFLSTTATSSGQRLALCPTIDSQISDFTIASRGVANLGSYF